MPNQYLVTWEIDVECESPEEAALEAWKLMRHPDSTANVFTVTDEQGGSVKVDLEERLQDRGPESGSAPK